MKVTTKSGFTAEVRESIGNDFRFVLLYRDFLQGEDATRQLQAMADMPELVLGKEQAQELYRHLMEQDGSVPSDKVIAELSELVAATKQAKN